MKAIMPVLDDSRKKPYYLQLYDYIKVRSVKTKNCHLFEAFPDPQG